jgi:hypothetical protein
MSPVFILAFVESVTFTALLRFAASAASVKCLTPIIHQFR